VSYRLSVSPAATAQILSLSSYYEGIREGLGAELEQLVVTMLESIAESPHRYQKEFGPVRRCLLKRFNLFIYYAVGTESVGIIEIRDARQKPPDWRSRGYAEN
jgi:plasmid stabilization system protein ParE